MTKSSQIAFFLMVLACVGLIGIWVGQGDLISRNSNGHGHKTSSDMHALFHGKLNVSAEQEKKIAGVEKEFKRLRTLYEGQMKTANLELAQAIKESGYESPKIEAIVHKIHGAMGSLQALSLEHLAQMEKILTDEQNQKLEEMVIEQLQRNAAE